MEYNQSIRERYSQLKNISKPSIKGSISSIDRIAEFRKKIEGTFSSKNEQKHSFIESEFKFPSKYSEKPSHIAPRFPSTIPLSKNSSLCSISVPAQPKLPEIISIDCILSLKKALSSITDEEIRDFPYLYSFTLKKFCNQVSEKLRNN